MKFRPCHHFFQPQIGAYYGAELCVVDLNLDNITDLLLVSAPMYNEKDQEGKVFIYTFQGSFGSQVKSKHDSAKVPKLKCCLILNIFNNPVLH